jgi:hypothetical protein
LSTGPKPLGHLGQMLLFVRVLVVHL